VNPDKYESGETVTLIVEAKAEYEVKTLVVKAGETVIETTKVGNNYTFTMPGQNVTVESSFGKILYALNIAEAVGGEIIADKEAYAKNETVTVTVKPATGYTRGTMSIKNGATDVEYTRRGLVFTFKMPHAPVNVAHTFNRSLYELNIKTSSFGAITADKEKYGYQDTVTLTVKPDSGYILDTLTVMNGSKEVEYQKKNATTYTFTMPASKNVLVSATYKVAPVEYKVTYDGGDFVNIRETASKTGTDLGDIPNGTVLEALEVTSEWVKVQYKDITGWVAMLNLTKVTN
jgi:hypothetical protein